MQPIQTFQVWPWPFDLEIDRYILDSSLMGVCVWRFVITDVIVKQFIVLETI